MSHDPLEHDDPMEVPVAATPNTLNFRSVFLLPHSLHGVLSASAIETIFSNSALQSRHKYSYIGMLDSFFV